MSSRMSEVEKSEHPGKAFFELFPDIGEEVDRRIVHSETRIKNWILLNVLANIVTLALIVVPGVYVLGQISTRADSIVEAVHGSSRQLEKSEDWMIRREIWENEAERWMVDQGFDPPRYGRPDGGR